MKHRLWIVEGLPCSGKSTLSAFVADELCRTNRVEFIDEGSGHHPADWENHALTPAGMLSVEPQIVPLGRYTGRSLEKLLPYKIYDGLPWETEKPVMLDKWREFVRHAKDDVTYVFNCVLLQNPMCETMMRFGFSEETSAAYIQEIAEIIRPMNPMVIYLHTSNVAAAVRLADTKRVDWLDAVIRYHENGAYGKRVGAKGFDGYIHCLEERQRRELRILEQLPLQHVVIENSQRHWQEVRENLRAFVKETV